MKKGINYVKKNWIDLILLFFLPVIFLSKNLKQSIISYLPDDSIISSFIVPMFIGLTAISITITVLFYQLYFNRYNLRNFSNEIFPIFLSLGIHICLGLITLCLFYYIGKTNTKLLCCYFFIGFIIRFIIFIISFKVLTLSYFIKKIGREKVKTLNNGKCSYDDIEKIFTDLSEYFNESIEKKESHYIDIVIEVINNIYLLYLNNSSKICCKITPEEKKKIERYLAFQLSKDFFIIVNTNLMDTVINKYMKFLSQYTELCLKAEKNYFLIQLFENFSSYYVNNTITESDSVYLCKYSFSLYKKTLNLQNSEIRNVIEDFYINTMFYSDYMFEKDSSKFDIFKYLSNMLSLLAEKKLYDEYKQMLLKVSEVITSELNNIDFLYVKTFFVLLKSQYSFYCDIDDIRNAFEKFIFNIAEFAIYIGNISLIKQIGLLYYDMQNRDFVKKELFENIISLFNKCCHKMPENAMCFVISFKGMTQKVFSISDALEIYEKIVHMTIGSNDSLTMMLIDNLIEDIRELKSIPKLFIQIFKEFFFHCIDIKSFDLLYSILDDLLEFIGELHDSKRLNEEIMEAFFYVWEELCNIITDVNQGDIQKYILTKLTDIDEYIDDLTPQYKKHILLILLHSSISAIESKNEELLRTCSNLIGWMIKKAIDKQDENTYKEGIDTTIKLFNLSSEVGVSDVFLCFESTIFTVIGSLLFLRKENEKLNYMYNAIGKLNYIEKKDPIEIGKNLRLNEAEYWSSFFDNSGNVSKLIGDYYKDYTEHRGK